MVKNKKFFIVAVLLVITIIPSSLFLVKMIHNSNDNDNIVKPSDIFINEDDYINYIESIRLPGISFTILKIENGDNFWKIAKEHNIDIDTLIGTNPLWKSIVAKVDQRIVVPSQRGVLHFVDTINDITNVHELYNVSKDNVITPSFLWIYKIKSLFIKGKKPIAVFVKNARPISDVMTPSLSKQFALREMFRSPLGGRLTSFFGRRMHPIFRHWGFHNGLDIAAPYGTPVGAARDGVVISCGWMGGYGKAVIIMHDNGFKTLYGHLSKINVHTGQKVKSGQFIGRVGSTGWSTGPHLHFTLWQNNKLINPMKVLW